MQVGDIETGKTYRFSAGSVKKVRVIVEVAEIAHVGEHAVVFLGHRVIMCHDRPSLGPYREVRQRRVYSSMKGKECEQVAWDSEAKCYHAEAMTDPDRQTTNRELLEFVYREQPVTIDEVRDHFGMDSHEVEVRMNRLDGSDGLSATSQGWATWHPPETATLEEVLRAAEHHAGIELDGITQRDQLAEPTGTAKQRGAAPRKEGGMATKTEQAYPTNSVERRARTFKDGKCQRCFTKTPVKDQKSVQYEGDWPNGRVKVGKATEQSHYCPDCREARKSQLTPGETRKANATKRAKSNGSAKKTTTKAKAKAAAKKGGKATAKKRRVVKRKRAAATAGEAF
jgi:predicted transcriptional regulator